MALTDLNVVLRLSTREFNREVKNVERSLQSASDRLSDIGNSLSLALTAPLGGLGGAAIVAAGEFERLRLGLEATMTDAGYSIQQAREELEKLREVAKAPGIDFEQAVQGSLRLQSVGLSAEQARETIAQFANGVAAAGGTAQNLEGVTRQISQIISKGKIFNEDLIVLKENMPSVSKALVTAFGTADAEGLQKLNISAEELVMRLTEELAKAPRVAGGIANAIQNAQVAVKEAAAKIGDSLNAAFDITGGLNKFADFVSGIADSFSKASPEVQRLIFSLGAFAIALGPGILLGRQLATTYINTTVELAKFARFLNAELARSLAGGATGIRNLITAFRALDLATKTTVIGLAVGVVVALGAALFAYTNASTDAAKAQQEFNKVLQDGKESVSGQIESVDQLVKAYKREGVTLEERRSILSRLSEIDRDRFGNLRAETALYSDVERAAKAYTDELIRQAQVKQAIDQIAKLKNELIDLKDESKLTFGQSTTIALKSFGSFLLKPAQAINALKGALKSAQDQVLDNEQRVKQSINNQIGQLQKFIDETSKITDFAPKEPAAPKPPAAPTPPAAPQEPELSPSEIRRQIRDIKEQLSPLETLPSNVKSGFDEASAGLADFAKKAGAATSAAVQPFTQAQIELQKYNKGVEDFAQRTGLLIEYVDGIATVSIDKFKIFEEAITNIGGAISEALLAGASGFETFKNAAINAISKVIGLLIQQFVAKQMVNAASSPIAAALGPAGSAALAAAAGGIASALFKRVVGAAKFAEGGVVYGPTLGLVGEYPGASTNPEVIAPLSKLKSLISPAGEMSLETRISGNDLLVLVERTQKQRSRTK
jgi:tape measure domain-containing protein